MKSLALITKELIGLEYELGRMDCFVLIVNYLQIRGYEIPKSYKGWTLKNYKKKYLKNPKEAKIAMVGFMESMLEEIPVHKAFAGDILLMSYEDSAPFLAIDGGNGVIIAASETRGVSPSTRRFYTTGRAFRCHR